MKKQNHFVLLRFAVVIWTAALPLISLAADQAITVNSTGIDRTASVAGLRTKITLPGALGQVTGWFLGILGSVFLVLMILGGFMWMTSAGNEERVTKAKRMVIAAIAGVLVIFLSYAFAIMIGDVLKAVSETT